MKIVFAFGWIPVLVIYTNKMAKWKGGKIQIWVIPVIKIRPKYRDDFGILMHELRHVEQFYLSKGLHYWKYRDDEWYRLRSEAKAFAIQLHFTPGRYNYFLQMLTDNYELTQTSEVIQHTFNLAISAEAKHQSPSHNKAGAL